MLSLEPASGGTDVTGSMVRSGRAAPDIRGTQPDRWGTTRSGRS